MEFVLIHGKTYNRHSDGLFYKEMTVEGNSYSVPMYLSRRGQSWRIYITLNRISRIQKYILDIDMKGATPAERTALSLAKAIETIKKSLAKLSENPSLKYINKLQSKKTGRVLGLSVKPIIAKTKPLDCSPIINIFVTMPGKKKRIPKSGTRLNIFTTTEVQFNEALRHAVLMRKYYEHNDYNNNQPQSRIDSVPEQMHQSLLREVDMSAFKYEAYIAEIEDLLPTDPLPLDEIHILETKDQIIVDRRVRTPGQIPERKSFKLSEFNNPKSALRIAHIYRAHLASRAPAVFDKFAG